MVNHFKSIFDPFILLLNRAVSIYIQMTYLPLTITLKLKGKQHVYVFRSIRAFPI